MLHFPLLSDDINCFLEKHETEVFIYSCHKLTGDLMLQVVTTFELPGCVDMWTVIGSKDAAEDSIKGEQEYTHAFMILSQQDSTMVSVMLLAVKFPGCF
jgi:hypothetical protein